MQIMKIKLLTLALLAISQTVLAQQIPGAGSQLRQLPPPAEPVRTEPLIRIEETTAPAMPGTDSASVLVNELKFQGARTYSEAELRAIARFTPGSQLTLPDLQAMAARITAHYRDNGYFVARAYLPAQDISNHVVTIAVSEGVYGKVDLRNQTHLSDGLVRDILDGPESGDPITIGPLESRLLRLSDIPGVKITSTLVPGTLPGSTDLVVDVAPGRRVTGFVDADNAGNPYTGEYRAGALLNLNNPLGRGDVASLRLLTSGPGLRYARASYQMMFGRATAGVAYSHLDYELGEQFEVLGANGTARVASVFGSVPLVRSRDTNLYAGLTFENKRFEDRMDLFPAADRRAQAQTLTASLHGSHQDDIGGGGLNTFYLNLTTGSLDIQTPAARALDAATARTDGRYNKLWLHATRLQRINDSLSLHAAFTGQLASKNLDPSEKMVLGGMDGIRAYPQGEAVGDEGFLVNLEARLLLAGLSDRVAGNVHLLGFVDHGRITIDKNPWYAGSNHRSLSGAGVGLAWNDPGNFSVRMYYARKLGSEDAISAPDKSGRFWIQAIKYF